MKTNSIDLTEGPLLKKIILFALPLIASGVLQQLFNSADVAVVGHFVGPHALAAVGSTTPLINLILNIFMGLSVGANVIIASLAGQKRFESINDAVHTIIMLAIICGIILTGIGLTFAGKILLLIETPEKVLVLAKEYLNIYFLGIPFILIYNFGSAILRGKGNSFGPSIYLIIAGVLNVLLNLLLVIVFKLGVLGVGIATTFSNFVSASLVLINLSKEKDCFKLQLSKLKLNKSHTGKIFRIGMPAGIQGMVFSLSNVVIQGALNTLGSDAMAGSAAGVNYEIFAYFIVSAFSQSAVTFTSQNYGAQKLDRCKKIYFYCMTLSVIFTMICSAVFAIFRFPLSAVYTSDAEAIKYSAERIMRVETVQFLVNSYEITAGVLRGMGYSSLPAIITVAGTCAIRLGWVATIFRHFHSYASILAVYPVSWIITGSAMICAYAIIFGRKLRGLQDHA